MRPLRVVFLFPFFTACSTSTASPRDASTPDGAGAIDASKAVTLPACKWPSASVIPPDSGNAPWSPSRAIVECGACVTDPNGGCEVGPSDGTTLCGDASSCLPCTILCRPDEYGLIGSDQGPNGAAPSVPASCRDLEPESGGAEDVYACCPCE